MKKILMMLMTLMLIVGIGLTIEPSQADASSNLKLTKTVKMYNQKSFDSGTPGSISPQTVKVVKKYNDGWYKVKTWLGDKYIAPNGYTLTLKHTTHLHESASLKGLMRDKWSKKNPISVSPQKVTVIAQKGDWYQIKTWLGNKWIAPYGVTARQMVFLGNEYHLNNKDLGELIAVLESEKLKTAIDTLPNRLSYIADFAMLTAVKPLLPKLNAAYKKGKGAIILKTANGAYLYRNQATTN